MALNLNEQAEYNRLLEEAISLANKLGNSAAEISFRNAPEGLNATRIEFTNLLTSLNRLREEWKEYTSDVSSTRVAFINIVDQIKNTNSGVRLATDAFSGLSSIAQRIYNIQTKTEAVDLKNIENLKNQVKSKINELSIAQRILSEEESSLISLQETGTITEEQSNRLIEIHSSLSKTNELLDTGLKYHQALIEALEEEEIILKRQADEENRALGINRIAGEERRKSLKDQILGKVGNTSIGKIFNTGGDGGGDAGGGGGGIFASGAGNFIGLTILMQIWKTLVDIDKLTGELAKSFNLTYDEASNLREELNSIANETGDINVTTKGLQESIIAVGNALGSNALLGKDNAVTMTKLREQAGFTNEELTEMTRMSLATGTSLENNTKNMLFAAKTTALNNGVLLNEKTIMNDIAKTSNSIKLSLANNPESLAKAVAQAKALGMSLEQVDKTASALLEIESSITNELEAELLTGKELNLEQARLYALNNDMEGLSREIAKNFGSAAEFSQMNRLQQEAAAKAVGMNREELAKILTDQEALRGLSGEEAKQKQAALDLARKQGMTEEEIKQQGMDNLMKQQSIQERLNAFIDKMKDGLVTLIQPLMGVLDIFTNILNVVGYILKPIGALMNGISSLGGPLEAILGTLMALGAAALFFNGSLTLGIGIATALAAIGYGMSVMESSVSKAEKGNDIFSPGYGERVLMGPEGTISLNNKDTVIAGTNLFNSNKQSSSPTNQQTDITPLISEMQSIKNILTQILSKEGYIYLDSTKIGTALSIGTSRIQ